MLSLVLSLLSPAQAFCGTYVSGSAVTLTNKASVIVMARQQGRTTLSMRNDYVGDLNDFGLVIPIPSSITEDDVRVISSGLFDKLEGYTQPREAAYTCDDWFGISEAAQAADTGFGGGGSSGFGCSFTMNNDYRSDTSPAGVQDSGVVVEEQFDLAEYSVWVLRAAGSEGLLAWLDSNGFVVPEGAQPVFDSYIEQDVRFLALKIDPTRVSDPDWLSPLQISYDDAAFQLPVRMGAISSAGVQDLVLYTLTDPTDGRVGISNYREATPPVAECMLDEGQDLPTWYAEKLEESLGLPAEPDQLAGQSGFSWITEYGWGSGACDPCTSVGPLSTTEVDQLGFDAHYGFYVSRLHLRYTPEAVTQDLMLYPSGSTDNVQQRYIQRSWALESEVPLCSGEVLTEPGTCYSSEYWLRRATGDIVEPIRHSSTGGCGGNAAILLLLPAAAMLRRRR
jgi:hypothetical protein